MYICEFEVGELLKSFFLFLIAGGSGVFPLPSCQITIKKTLSKYPISVTKVNFHAMHNIVTVTWG